MCGIGRSYLPTVLVNDSGPLNSGYTSFSYLVVVVENSFLRNTLRGRKAREREYQINAMEIDEIENQ